MHSWIAYLSGGAVALPLVAAVRTPQVWLAALALALVAAALSVVVMLRKQLGAAAAENHDRRGGVERRNAERRAEHGCNTSLGSAVAAMLVASVLVFTTAGCTAKQKETTYQVVQQIAVYAPTVEAALESTATAIAALDPSIAAPIMVGVVGFDALKTAFNASLTAYLAKPDATTLQQLQAAIDAIETNVSTASLNAIGIKNAASSALALSLLKSILTVASYVFSLISTTESTAQLQALAADGRIQLARLRPLMDEGQLRSYAHEQGVPWMFTATAVNQAFDQAAAAGL